MYYVYVLKNDKGELYKGFSLDPIARTGDHNQGKVRSTKSERPWELIYFEAFVNKTDALREEKFLKTGKGRERIRVLLENTMYTLENQSCEYFTVQGS